MRTGPRWLPVVGGLAVAGLALAAFVGVRAALEPDGPAVRLRSPAEDTTASSTTDVRPGGPVVVGAMPLCLEEPGRVVVTGVEALGDIDLRGFVVRPNPFADPEGMMIGDARGTLAANGLVSVPGLALTDVCPTDDNTPTGYELIVELWPGDRNTSAAGFRISYTDGRAEGTVTIPYRYALCRETDAELGCP